MQVVVVDEGHPPAEGSVERSLVDVLEMMFTRIIGRVCLAREHELDRSLGCGQQASQSLGVGEDELGALVLGEPPGKSDGQRVWVEQCPGSQDLAAADPLVGPALTRPLANEIEQIPAQFLSNPPELGVRNLAHAVPNPVVALVSPVRAEILVEQLRQSAGHPRSNVDAVCQGAHRVAVVLQAWPDRRPHLSGHASMELADGVDLPGRAQCQRGHIEVWAAAVVVITQRQKRLTVTSERAPAAGEMGFDEAERERVVSGRDRCVRGEHRCSPHFGQGGLEALTLLDQLAHPLEHDECGMALVEMPDHRVGAQSSECPHAADSKNDLLLDTSLGVAAVQPGGELPVPRRVFLETGVEEIQLGAPEAHAPDRDLHRTATERHRDDTRSSTWCHRRGHRRVGPVQLFVAFLLPAVG